MRRVLFLTGHDEDLALTSEEEAIKVAFGPERVDTILRATRAICVVELPRRSGCSIAHYSGHGSLDVLLDKHVRRSMQALSLPEPNAPNKFRRECVDAIRKLLQEEHDGSAIPMPRVSGEFLTRDLLESFEAGVCLCPPESSNEPYEVVKPDGFAKLFEICVALECIVLNCCVGLLQGKEFLIEGSRAKHVICVRGRISDEAALEFSKGFYSSYGAGHTVHDSYVHACAALAALYGNRAIRAKQVEDIGGMPQIWSRPTGQDEPSSEQRSGHEVQTTTTTRESLGDLNDWLPAPLVQISLLTGAPAAS